MFHCRIPGIAELWGPSGVEDMRGGWGWRGPWSAVESIGEGIGAGESEEWRVESVTTVQPDNERYPANTSLTVFPSKQT